MKLGIKRIECIHAADVAAWMPLPAGSGIALSGYLSSTLKEIPFTQETGSFKETWKHDEAGRSSSIEVSFNIRADRMDQRDLLQDLHRCWYVYVVTTMDGVRRIVGSRSIHPTMEFSDVISGNSLSEYEVTISLDSPFGALFATD